jgi:hypothetical protein
VITVIALMLATVALPPAVYIFFRRSLRDKAFFLFPFGVGLEIALLGFLSVIFHKLPYGWTKYGLVSGLASTGAFLVLEIVGRRAVFLPKRIFSSKALWVLCSISFLVCLDNAIIFQKQGFRWDGGETYFRPPLHDDMERHTLVTNALIRHEGSPLLVNGKFLYQLTWHHLTAFFASLVPYENSRYHLVEGVSWATGVLFVFVLLWAFYLWRPVLFLRWRWGALALLLLFSHVDIYHFVTSSLFSGTHGIEADWSYAEPSFIRYFSLKLILLTAPQHAGFFLLLTLYLVSQSFFRRSPSGVGRLLEVFFLVSLFIFSPLMSAFFFLPFGVVEVFRSLRERRAPVTFLARAISGFALGYVFHFLLFGFWPHQLTQRPGTSSLVFLNTDWEHILLLPLLALGTAGILGMISPFLRPYRRTGAWAFGTLLLGLVLFHYGVTDTEVRRHFSMVSAFVAAVLLVTQMPSPRVFWRRREGRVAIASLALVAIAFHGYYLYCYLGKPSAIDPKIPWKDYFAMNKVIEAEHPGLPVIGAVDPKGVGNDYPVAMQVTPSFSMPNHAVIHTAVTEEKFKVLRKIMASGDVAPYALSLGYKAILWGPVEETAWGERVKRRFIKESELIAKTGSVGLYRLVDTLRDRFEGEVDLASADFYYKVASAFAEERWFQESLGYFFRAVELDPEHRAANLGLGKVLELYERKEEAAFYYQRGLVLK